MTTIASINHTVTGRTLSELVGEIVPNITNFDPLGFVSGYRAFLIYTQLSSMSDSALAQMDIQRTELPRLSMKAALSTKSAR